jgi:glycosyltransferase involved in cell wall biosynthesis
MDTNLTREDFVVIPTCCDTTRFTPKLSKQNPVIVSCVGTMLSAWFDLILLKIVIEESLEVFDDLSFEFITNDSEKKVRQKLGLSSNLNNKITFKSVAFSDIPETIKRHDISLLLYSSTTKSEIARSPTRFAELMASGVAVLATPGIGDLDSLIQDYNVGAVVNNRSRDQINKIMIDLKFLIIENGFEKRCTKLANEIYQVSYGAEKLSSIYRKQYHDR